MMAERPTEQPLESYSHYLTEFEHQRFDDVEIPGQYSLVR
jgi:transformation/transcription domain-associated protein